MVVVTLFIANIQVPIADRNICILNDSVWSNNLIKMTLSERNSSLINLITEPEISFFQNRDNYVELLTNPLLKSQFEMVIRYLLDFSTIIDDTDKMESEVAKLEYKEETITNGELILLVEDNDSYRKILLKRLHFLGFNVDTAEDGIQGLRAWETGRYRLILTACFMPDMDGYDMTTQIRMRENEVSRIPIIALTSIAIESERKKYLSAGADEYITKPANIEQLRLRLGHWIMTDGNEIDKIGNEVIIPNNYEGFNLGPDIQVPL